MWIPVALLATWRLMCNFLNENLKIPKSNFDIITVPISSYLSEIYENNEDYQRYIVEASMGFLFSGLIICSLVKNLVVHVIFYGIFCGKFCFQSLKKILILFRNLCLFLIKRDIEILVYNYY